MFLNCTAVTGSIVELQRELNLAAECAVRAASALQQTKRTPDPRVGRIQNRRVEEVAGLGPELHLVAFGEVEEFRHARVERTYPGTADRGNTAGAERARILRPEVGRIKPLITP